MSAVVTTQRSESNLLRGAALGSVALVTATWLSVLYYVVSVVGGRATFLALVVAAAVAAAMASALTHRRALAVSAALLGLGLTVYLAGVPASYWAAMSPGRAVADMVALLTGFSVIRMVDAGTWALAVTPGPMFLVAYFAVRGEYVRSAGVSATALGFFVLTGDAATLTTLLGVLGAAGAAGFAVLSRHGGSRAQVETLAAAMAVMILASTTVTAVPGGERTPLMPDRTSVQADLVRAGERTTIGGSIRLSAEVQFVVESEEEAYWRAAAYDRYTGNGWVRTGGTASFPDRRESPPGDRYAVEQTITARNTLDVLVGAARPQSVRGVDVQLSGTGTVELAETLSPGETYSVTSLRRNATPAELRRADGDYPPGLVERYTQLPSTTGDRVKRLTDNLTAGANSTYEAATIVERWLEQSKGYSQTVTEPEGGVAESFIFEMEAGYCVYFATSMVTMLRTQGIPARYVVGYTPGQRVSEEEWVVRGYDSHAWVEVYLPDQGWVRFDPTPSGPRRAAEIEELTEARVSGESGVDVPGSTNGTYVPPTPTRTPSGGNGTLTRPSTLPEWWLNESQGGQGGTAGDPSTNATLGPGPRPTTTVENNSTGTPTLPSDPAAFVGARDAERGNGGDGGSGGTPLPRVPLDVLAVWSVLTVGLAAGARRSGVSNALYRAAWLRYHPRTDDRAAAVEAAFDRVEYLLARDHRERRPGETVREYLADVDADERATKVASLRERARYAGGVSELEAERARNLAAAFVSDRTGVATTFNRLLS